MDFGFDFETFFRTVLALAAIVLGIASLWLALDGGRDRYHRHRHAHQGRADTVYWAAVYGLLGLSCALLAWQWPF